MTKSMDILIDTNILLNYLTSRPDVYLDESVEIMKLCADGKCQGYAAFHSLSTIWHVLRKWSEKDRRESLSALMKILDVASASKDEIVKAIRNDSFKDFDDCLQSKCAETVSADYIITCNLKDYTEAEIPAILPNEFLKLFDSK